MMNSLHNWQNDSDKLRLGIRIIVIALTLVVIVCVMTRTIRDLRAYPGIDLRAKVVGARLLIRGMNPYYEFLSESLPDHLRMFNEDTYSPSLLLLYAPLCELSWKTQRVFYFTLDWIAILVSFGILSLAFPKGSSTAALWVGFVFIFINSLGFRLHLERGQYYIELALLAAAASVCLLRKSESWFSALPLAILVLVRPTYAICIVGLLILHRVRHAAYAVCLCVLLLAVMFPLTGVVDWKSYSTEIGTNERELVGDAYRPTSQLAPAMMEHVAEGVDFSKSLSLPGYLADRTLLGLARSSVSPSLARLVHRIAPSERRFEWLNSAGLLLMCAFDFALMYGFSRKRTTGLIPIAFLFLAPLNLELFAPQHFAYCDVMILAPTLLILAAIVEKRSRGSWWLYGTILAIASALPWLSVHFDKHVPLVSFFSYVGILGILNLISIAEFVNPPRKPPTLAVSGDTESANLVSAYRQT